MVGRLAILLLLRCLTGCERIDPSQEVGQYWMDALNSHDPARIVELMQPGTLPQDPMIREPLGPPAYAKWLSSNWAIWKDRVYITRKMLTTSKGVVVEWRLQQTHPSGKAVPIEGATVLDIVGQRISGVRNYYNATAYLQFVTAS